MLIFAYRRTPAHLGLPGYVKAFFCGAQVPGEPCLFIIDLGGALNRRLCHAYKHHLAEARPGGRGKPVGSTRGRHEGHGSYRPRIGGLYFFPSEDLIEFKISLEERFR